MKSKKNYEEVDFYFSCFRIRIKLAQLNILLTSAPWSTVPSLNSE